MLRLCLLRNNDWFKSVTKKWRIVVFDYFDRFRDSQNSHRLHSIQDLIEVFKFRKTKKRSRNRFQICFAGNNVCFAVDDVMRPYIKKNMADRDL